MRKDIDLNYFKKCLEGRLEAIMARQEAQEENEAPVELDQSRVGRLSRMDAMQQQAMAQATGRPALSRSDNASRTHLAAYNPALMVTV